MFIGSPCFFVIMTMEYFLTQRLIIMRPPPKKTICICVHISLQVHGSNAEAANGIGRYVGPKAS